LAELQRVVITVDEVRQTRIRWENETGMCSHCGGSGQQVKSTGISGTTYRECISCDGTGKALHLRLEVEA
jgi:DnaJ-class molecular chaperone